MRTRLAAALLGLTLAACSALRPAPPVKDRDLGLSKTSVFDVPSPPAWKAEGSAPGEKPPPPRLSTQLPPVVPHGLADVLPITREQNGCVDCHAVAGPKKAGEPTPLPASHYTDLRRAPQKVAERVAGARWVCTACHVGRTDAPPLVRSGYRP